jgi:hypothetical protein
MIDEWPAYKNWRSIDYLKEKVGNVDCVYHEVPHDATFPHHGKDAFFKVVNYLLTLTEQLMKPLAHS